MSDKVLVLGAGPLTPECGTGAAYSAWRTADVLSREGFTILGLDSSETSLLTIPGTCSRFFLEPMTAESVEAVLEREGPACIAGYSAGLRGMLLSTELFKSGILKRCGCRMLGPSVQAVHRTQDRALFKEVLMDADLFVPRFASALSLEDGIKAMRKVGFPLVIRPHYTAGGLGSSRACNREEYLGKLMAALRRSPVHEVTVEEDLSGWREFSCLVARDQRGEKAVLGIIEQLEPAGMHGGDSLWISPPRSMGGELEYFLKEMAGKTADILDIRGVLELEILVHPRLEEIYVSEAHPGPGQSSLFVLFACGCDAAEADLLLALGRGVEDLAISRGSVGHVAVRLPFHGGAEVEEDSLLDMERSSVGEWMAWGKDLEEASKRLRGLLADADVSGGPFPADEGDAFTMLPPEVKLRRAWRSTVGLGRCARRLPEWFSILSGGGGKSGSPRVFPLPFGGEKADEAREGGVLLLGGEPHHPGRGAEADINAVNALLALRGSGKEPLLYGENPLLALLSCSLGFEVFMGALDAEALTEFADERGVGEVLTQYGGEASLSLTSELSGRGCVVPGLSPGPLSFRSSFLREQRLFIEGAPQIVAEEEVESLERALEWAQQVGYPHVAYTRGPREALRTSILYGPEDLRSFYLEKVEPYGGRMTMRPLYEDAVVVLAEVVALPGGALLLGLAQNLEDAGIAADDCMISVPPLGLTPEQVDAVEGFALRTAEELGILGNLRMRIAISEGDLRLEEIYLGASATLPLIALLGGWPAQEWGIKAACGMLVDPGREPRLPEGLMGVRRTVLSPRRAGEEDLLPVSERRSLGSLAGTGPDLGVAFAKVFTSELDALQGKRNIFISVANRDKRAAVMMVKEMASLGFTVLATEGTAEALRRGGMEVVEVRKLREGRPSILDYIKNGEVDLIVNTPRGKGPRSDGFYIRSAAARYGIPCITDMRAATLLVEALNARREGRVVFGNPLPRGDTREGDQR